MAACFGCQRRRLAAKKGILVATMAPDNCRRYGGMSRIGAPHRAIHGRRPNRSPITD